MKILLPQETDWLKRNPGQQHHLAEMLSLRGHEVRVIDYEVLWKTQGKRELYSRREVFKDVSKIHDGAKVTIIRPSIVKIPWLDYISVVFSHKREIERQIKEFVPDVIVGFDILNAYLAMKAAKRNMIPFVSYWNDVNHRLLPFKPFQLIGMVVESRTLKQADKVLAINEKLSDYMIKLGAPPKLTQVLRAGINFKQFRLDISGDAIREQYKLGKEDIVLFFMGWHYLFSGLKEVALELSKTQNRNIKLLTVGDGDAYEELQQIRESYNLHDRIILAGKKSYQEIPAFIAASDVCLLPAYPTEKIMQDIVPIKMYEYMAMKKPVIATRLPGVLKEFGEDNGVVYIDRPEDAVEKAIELVAGKSLDELGSKARNFVERYSWDNIADEFEEILKNAIKEKTSRLTT